MRIIRNRPSLFLLVAAFLLSSCNPQKEGEWTPIFNGSDLTGWTPKFSGQAYGQNYLNTFQVKDGKLVASYDAYTHFDENFGHLFYREKLSHYRLRLEYRFVGDTVPGVPPWAYKNSGIKIHAPHPSELPLDQTLLVAVEAQLLGGDDTSERFTGNVCTAGTHIVMDGQRITQHCTNSNYPAIRDASWVQMEVEVHGSDSIIHKVNGEVVMKYSQPQYDAEDAFARKRMEDGYPGIISEGYIALQAEGHPVEFRNIEIMELMKLEE